MKIRKTQFRIPTKEEFENLCKHFSRWNEEKKILEILNDSLSVLELPATGYLDHEGVLCFEDVGCYWSSTVSEFEFDCDDAYHFYCDLCSHYTSYCCTSDKQVVRLVSDEPFDGGIKFGNIYWKPENEFGYFTYDEAMENLISNEKENKYNC